MTIGARLATSLAVVVAILVLVILGLCWRAGLSPKRPANVSSSAVYIRWLPLPLPHRKRGVWVNCWLQQDEHANSVKLRA
jgi:uncharacterized membrane protein